VRFTPLVHRLQQKFGLMMATSLGGASSPAGRDCIGTWPSKRVYDTHDTGSRTQPQHEGTGWLYYRDHMRI
jgi:hypothetical protein